MTYMVCQSIFLQEILEEVRKELQKVKEEIIGGEVKYSLKLLFETHLR